MLELSDKDVKEAIIKMFQWAVMNMLETNEKIENLSKEIEVIKLRNTISDMKIFFDGLTRAIRRKYQ